MKTGMQDSVMNEKNILMMTNSSFITKLWDCEGVGYMTGASNNWVRLKIDYI